MQFTRNAALLLLILAALGVYLGYLLYTKKVPCVTPVSYNIKQLDSQFGLSESEAHVYLAAAAQAWNDAIGKEIFIEADKPDLPIYFQYGSVQYAVDTLESLSDNVEALKVEATKTANEYATLKKSGGDPAKLQALLKKYYDLKDRISADIAKSQGVVPEGDITDGRYVSDEGSGAIYLYSFQTKTKLIRALEHEFGHALGLGHVSNPDSVMYPQNENTNLRLTNEDITELKKVCTNR